MNTSRLLRYSQLLLGLMLALFVEEQLCGKPGSRFLFPKATSCPLLKLQNGKVRLRSKGRIARFVCNDGFRPFGDKTATCLGGRWEGTLPKCVRPGCLKTPPPANGLVTPYMGGAVLSFECNSGYRLGGASLIYCNGIVWNSTAPTCGVENSEPELSCDFEDERICGWRNDPQHSFDWTRHRFATPSGHVGTGPASDHTRGQEQDGYYMYVESSGRQMLNDTARLFSPVFPPETSEDACFVFWYHMYGATTGTLNIYQKLEGAVLSTVKPVFFKSGEQGNMWHRGVVRLESTDKPYQVVVEGVPGRGYLGDSAIDDVQLSNGSDCLEPTKEFTEITSNVETGAGVLVFDDDTQSCRHRCSNTPSPPAAAPENSTQETVVLVTCDCYVGCLDNGTCCPDYSSYCILAKVTPQPAVPTFEYRTIASIHYLSLIPPRPTLPKPPPLPPLPPKPTDMTSHSTQTTISVMIQKPIALDQKTTLEVKATTAADASVIPTSQAQIEVTGTSMIKSDVDESSIGSSGFSEQFVGTEANVGSSELQQAADSSLSSNPELASSSAGFSPTLNTGFWTEVTSEAEQDTTYMTETVTYPTETGTYPTEATTNMKAPTTEKTETATVIFETNQNESASHSTIKTSTFTAAVSTQMSTTMTTTQVKQTNLKKKYYKSSTRATLPKETRMFTSKPRTNKYFPIKIAFVPKKTTTVAPTTQNLTLKPTTKNIIMFYPNKDVQTNYLLKKELLDPKRLSGKLWQQPQKAAQDKNTSSASKTIGIVGGIALLLVAFGVVVFAVVRRRRTTLRGHDSSDDSDVRFLTADEVLDFNLARPTEEDDCC